MKKIVIMVLILSTLFVTSCSQGVTKIGDKCNSNSNTITENTSGQLLWCEHRKDALQYDKWLPIENEELKFYIKNKKDIIDEKNKCEEVLSKIINQPWLDALAMISKNGFSYGYESSEGWIVGGGDGSLITVITEDGLVVSNSSFGCDPIYKEINYSLN